MAQKIKITKSIQDVFQRAVELSIPSTMQIKQVLSWKKGDFHLGVEFNQVKAVVMWINEKQDEKVTIHETIRGSGLFHYKPPRTRKMTPLLQKLKNAQDAEIYRKMVAGVTPKKINMFSEFFSHKTFKGQLGLGLDLILTMGTFFLFFYVISAASPQLSQYKLIFGTFGMVFGFVVDMILLVIKLEKMNKKKGPVRLRSPATMMRIRTRSARVVPGE